MKFQDIQHDEGVLEELGQRLARVRIGLDLTQADLARRAGVGKRTVERLEAGETTQTRTLFRIFRELGLLDRAELLLPEPALRPSQEVRQAETLPRRVGRKRSGGTMGGKWKWGDET